MNLEPQSISLHFRPPHYGPDLCPELSLAGRVRGTWRRLGIQQAYDQGAVDQLTPRAFEETLSPEQIKALEEGNRPSQVSGERLPRLEPDEVEVARIVCWAIKKAPVIALYARPLGEGAYALRFVNEFQREILDYPKHIPRPLSLAELAAVFHRARLGEQASQDLIWYLAIGCERRGWPVTQLIRGICPVSAYYPDLKRLYHHAFDSWARRGGLPRAFGGATITKNSCEE